MNERWWVWGSGALLVAWSLGYACARGQYEVTPIAVVLLVVMSSVTAGLVRCEIADAVTRALRPWRRASERKVRAR